MRNETIRLQIIFHYVFSSLVKIETHHRMLKSIHYFFIYWSCTTNNNVKWTRLKQRERDRANEQTILFLLLCEFVGIFWAFLCQFNDVYSRNDIYIGVLLYMVYVICALNKRNQIQMCSLAKIQGKNLVCTLSSHSPVIVSAQGHKI